MNLLHPVKIRVAFALLIFVLSVQLSAQSQNAIDITDSNYVAVKFQEIAKNKVSSGVKFINTDIGKITKVTFDDETYIKTLEHIKIDALNINSVLVITGKAVKKNSEFSFESLINLYTANGELQKSVRLAEQITEFVINRKSGKIVFILAPEMLKSGSRNAVQSEVVYDLKTLTKM